MLDETSPCALPWGRPRPRPVSVRGLGVFIAKPERTPLAYGTEDVFGLGLAGLSLAFRVVVRFFGFFGSRALFGAFTAR